MTASRTYCPTCAEYAIDTGERRCAWCDTTLERRDKQNRRVYKVRVDRKLSRRHVKLAYEAYQSGHSLRGIAAKIYEDAGYASVKSCANALHKAFVREGWPLRGRVAAVVKVSTTHGHASRDNKAEYKRWRRRQDPEKMRPCAGVKTTYPNKDRPCRRFAQDGGDFCFNHDPERRDEVLATAANARKSLGHEVCG